MCFHLFNHKDLLGELGLTAWLLQCNYISGLEGNVSKFTSEAITSYSITVSR